MAGPKVRIVDKDNGKRMLEFFKRMRAARDGRVKVGVLADSDKGGLHVAGSDLTVAEIAAVQEYGTEDGHVPPRSFLRSTFDEQREPLVRLGEKLMDAVLDGKMTTEKALGVLGAKLASDTKNKITQTEIPPPNAPSTIEHKGSSHPLVDTGRMVNAITWQVDMGDAGKRE